MMYSDTHIHSSFSGDSDTPPEAQIEKAITLGMNSMCFTDHHDYDVSSDIDFNLDIPAYMGKMAELSEKYSCRMEILTGIELGLQPRIKDYLDKLTAEYAFDYIIGSVHFIDDLDPYYPEFFEKHGAGSYELYFKTVLDCVSTCGSFDSLGHLDYIVRYGRKHGLSYSYREYSDIIDEILKRIISDGKALECNTGGLMRGLSESNPGADVFRRYRELGGELVTIGSDAHSPEALGCFFHKAGEMLRNLGYKYYAVYKNRKPVMEKL